MVINDNELSNIYGGASASKAASIGILFGIIATFIIGVIDGFKRPLACNQ